MKQKRYTMMSRASVEDVKPLLFFFSLLLIFLVSGCTEKSIINKQTNVPIATDQCISLICGDKEFCFKGECVCSQGFNNCNGKCISNSTCCTSNDCQEGYFCSQANKCEKGCEDQLCESNKICDESKQKCICEPGTIWCDNQRKCIKQGNCCTNLDCPHETCTPTIAFVNLCIDSNSIVGCEKIPEGEEKTAYVNENKYTLFVKRIYDENILLFLNGKAINFNPDESYEISEDTKMYSKLVKDFGGTCTN